MWFVTESTPPPEQESCPVGQPRDTVDCGGVSDTRSPELEQPPWKTW